MRANQLAGEVLTWIVEAAETVPDLHRDFIAGCLASKYGRERVLSTIRQLVRGGYLVRVGGVLVVTSVGDTWYRREHGAINQTSGIAYWRCTCGTRIPDNIPQCQCGVFYFELRRHQ